jgi:hypothetical protein
MNDGLTTGRQIGAIRFTVTFEGHLLEGFFAIRAIASDAEIRSKDIEYSLIITKRCSCQMIECACSDDPIGITGKDGVIVHEIYFLLLLKKSIRRRSLEMSNIKTFYI